MYGFVTVPEFSALMGISTDTVYRLVKNDAIPYYRVGLDAELTDPQERTIEEMEPIHYEKYDYVMIACRSELDYNDLVRKLGIEGAKVKIAKKEK